MPSGEVLNRLITVFSLISFILVLIPLPFHIKMKNTPSCIYIFWVALASFNQFINAIIWNGNTVDWAPVWCDISSRIIIAVNVALPAAALCVMRHFHNILTLRASQRSNAQKRREFYVNLAIGVGLPILSLPSYYIVQVCRYAIFENIGCLNATTNAALAVPFQAAWPLCIGVATSVYCANNYAEVRRYLHMASTKQYIRLTVLAILSIFATVPLSLLIIISDLAPQNLRPWLGWAVEHSEWEVIMVASYAQWGARWLLQASRWFNTLCAFSFFAFFGFADEVWAGYGRAFRAASRKVLSWASWVRGKFSKPKLAEHSALIQSDKGPSDLPIYHSSQATQHNLASAFSLDASFVSFDSAFSLEEKYPWVANSSIGTLPASPLSLHEYSAPRAVPSHTATYHLVSPEDSMQAF